MRIMGLEPITPAWKAGHLPINNIFAKRKKGFEPSTSTLARSHSTSELLSLILFFRIITFTLQKEIEMNLKLLDLLLYSLL